VERHFGPATIFEHGPVVPGTPLGCGIDHLHLHVAPLEFSLVQAVNSFVPGLRWGKIDLISDVRKLHANSIGYALVQEGPGDLLWCRSPKHLKQMLRQAIARSVGRSLQFDYSSHPHLQNVVKTLERLSVG
jgi:hypothetical protein